MATNNQTGFENVPDVELCREWEQIMQHNTSEEVSSSVRFLRICQELHHRKIGPKMLGEILAETNSLREDHLGDYGLS